MIPEDNHIVLYEVGAPQVISAVGLRLLSSDNGKINIGELENKFRPDDIHFPRTGLICSENAHLNGKVVPVSNIKDVYSFSKNMGVPMHLDGARIFNAAIRLEVEPASITWPYKKFLCRDPGPGNYWHESMLRGFVHH